MSSANPVSVSFDKSLTCLDHSEKLKEDIPYRKAVSSLMYLVVSRPDIAYSVGVLSRGLDNPSKVHWCLVKKVLKYFSGGAITWALKCQMCISLSITEAKFFAANQACKEVIWLYRLFMEIHHLQYVPVLQVDNQSAI
ncbi:hypothetical protein AVEN_54315-1 [Araneus ventricosus]|uniref:Retrovirus-related Pol polyprotein from transposon TNT 1-94 n=1 Tax=Araneus ventricosus TaxID=182803 RepID=A0A4Y2NB94_ARAVE|nr:hypothetical protein AVEN_54315-1 [Araneus ventricosus]